MVRYVSDIIFRGILSRIKFYILSLQKLEFEHVYLSDVIMTVYKFLPVLTIRLEATRNSFYHQSLN